MSVLSLVVLLILFFPTSQSAQASQAALPLDSGRTWEYLGSARWTGLDQRVDTATIRWTMQILTTRGGPGLLGALVRGWIQELAWYQPGQTPGYSILLARGDRLYHVSASDSASALLTLQRAIEPGAPPPQGWELIVDSALAVGHLYGQLAERGDRSDTFYAWYVESGQAIRPPSGWSVASPTVLQWRLVYRTAPDHQVLDLVPGLGITHYGYRHHGTVAESDVELISVRQVP